MTTSGLERANRVHGWCSCMRATGSVGVEHFFSLNTSACAASRSFAFPAREPIADEKSSDDRFDALQERELPRAHPARGPAARGWRALRPRVSRATPVTNRRQNQSYVEAAEKHRESRRQPRRRFRATPQHPGRRPHAARPAGAPGGGRTRAPTTALCEALREQVWIGAARRAETAVVRGPSTGVATLSACCRCRTRRSSSVSSPLSLARLAARAVRVGRERRRRPFRVSAAAARLCSRSAGGAVRLGRGHVVGVGPE